jgi:hypothetical protein
MKVVWALLGGSFLIAASILFIGRYEIAPVGYGLAYSERDSQETIYRLDRWTGHIDYCGLVADEKTRGDPNHSGIAVAVQCPAIHYPMLPKPIDPTPQSSK